MSSAFPSDRKNLETNSGPRSEVTCSGTPCFENTCIMNKTARSSDVQLMVVGMNIPCFEKRSTITKIASESEEVGSGSMKSIEMEFHGRSGIGSCLSKP